MVRLILILFFFNLFVYEGSSQVIRNLQARYSIKKIRGWNVRKDSTSTVIYESAPKRTHVYEENVQINVYPASGMSLNSCFQTYFTANLPMILENYQVIDVKDNTLNGEPIKILKFSHTMEEFTMVTMAFVMVRNDKLYYIFAMSTKEEFDNYEASFYQMISSFRIH